MKKYYFLIILALILGLVLTGCSLLSNVGQVPATEQNGISSITKNSTNQICVDFESTELTEGDTVEGKGTVNDWLNISLDGKDLILIKSGTSERTKSSYMAGGGYNKCLYGSYGFGCQTYSNTSINRDTVLENEDIIVFEFPTGMKVKDFSIWMFDFGDYYESAGEHTVILKAYGDITYENIYSSLSGDFPEPKSSEYDACHVDNKGKKLLSVSGDNIYKVELEFVTGIDIGIAFDNICFTLETNICTTDLIAGQTETVGDAEVKYTPGDDFISVNYSTDAPWLMEEIHFHASFDGPGAWGQPVVNKAGNPAPGQFLVVDEDLGGLGSYSFEIPLSDIGDDDCGDLYFAAHAKVFTLTDFYGEIVSAAGSDTNVSIYYNEPIDLLTPGDADVNGLDAIAVIPHSSWSGISLTSSAVWIAADDPATPDGSSTWMLFKRMFEIPVDAINISGTLKIKSDNAERVIINGNLLECEDSYICGNIFGGIPGDTHQWDRLNTHILVDNLQAGANTLDIWVRNYRNTSPIGLIYDLEYEYQIKDEETAWGEGDGFPGKNWAMYFGCVDLVPCSF